MREGIVLYNNEGTPIWACANVDARAAREVSELKELHNNTFENEVYRATGQTLALSAIPRLLWLAHHRSDIYRQASTITMISDWLAYMLSGELAVDPSNAGTTGLLDLTTRDWKPALLDMAGLRADILSPVKETGTLLGVVSSQAAELCGLKAGTPVVVGGGIEHAETAAIYSGAMPALCNAWRIHSHASCQFLLRSNSIEPGTSGTARCRHSACPTAI
ncbi:autoinducer-2 (AI-2) kinase [Escherichia coli ECA-0157]|nr:autoinducer-2 (AI-2) kinase [Escherichia coli ECA-0157]